MADDNRFVRQLPDGTTIFGDKRLEGTPGYKHGHSGTNFTRTEHSTLGSAAVDAAMGKPSPGHTTGNHPTTRT